MVAKRDVALSESEAVLLGLKSCLEKISLLPTDFNRWGGTNASGHSKIIKTLWEEWRKSQGFGQALPSFLPSETRPAGGPGIDLVGRKSRNAYILLAVEVDNNWKEESLQKLADIKAVVKAWVIWEKDYKEGASRWFEWWKGEAANFLHLHGSVEPGEVFLFYKMPTLLWEAQVP